MGTWLITRTFFMLAFTEQRFLKILNLFLLLHVRMFSIFQVEVYVCSLLLNAVDVDIQLLQYQLLVVMSDLNWSEAARHFSY